MWGGRCPPRSGANGQEAIRGAVPATIPRSACPSLKEGQPVGIMKHLSLGLLILCPALSPSQENAKPVPVKPGERLTGLWRGEYQYPQGGGQAPVRFELVLLQDGSTVGGVIKEPNTFGSRPGPFLAAVFKGSFDAQAGKLTFKKTYDGTLGPNHDVEYTGELSKDGM